MKTPDPIVRVMVLCDDIQVDDGPPQRVSLVDVVTNIQCTSHPPFPAVHEELCLYAALTEGRGQGNLRVVLRFADSDEVIWQSGPHRVEFSDNPLESIGVRFRMSHIPLDGPGLYLVELWYNDAMIGTQPLFVR